MWGCVTTLQGSHFYLPCEITPCYLWKGKKLPMPSYRFVGTTSKGRLNLLFQIPDNVPCRREWELGHSECECMGSYCLGLGQNACLPSAARPASHKTRDSWSVPWGWWLCRPELAPTEGMAGCTQPELAVSLFRELELETLAETKWFDWIRGQFPIKIPSL